MALEPVPSKHLLALAMQRPRTIRTHKFTHTLTHLHSWSVEPGHKDTSQQESSFALWIDQSIALFPSSSSQLHPPFMSWVTPVHRQKSTCIVFPPSSLFSPLPSSSHQPSNTGKAWLSARHLNQCSCCSFPPFPMSIGRV